MRISQNVWSTCIFYFIKFRSSGVNLPLVWCQSYLYSWVLLNPASKQTESEHIVAVQSCFSSGANQSSKSFKVIGAKKREIFHFLIIFQQTEILKASFNNISTNYWLNLLPFYHFQSLYRTFLSCTVALYFPRFWIPLHPPTLRFWYAHFYFGPHQENVYCPAQARDGRSQLINHAGNVELIPPKVLAGCNRGQADGTAMTPGAFSV